MPANTVEYALHDEWLDFVESSAAFPIVMSLLGQLMGGMPAEITALTQSEVAKTLDHIASRTGEGPFLMGDQLTLADIQMSYLLSLVKSIGKLANLPC